MDGAFSRAGNILILDLAADFIVICVYFSVCYTLMKVKNFPHDCNVNLQSKDENPFLEGRLWGKWASQVVSSERFSLYQGH